MAAQTGLSREGVVLAASQLVDQEGWRQLTMTALARVLGVQGPTLYHHVGSLEALLSDVQVQALADLGNQLQAAAMGKAGAECFRALADSLCSFANEHPGLYELSQGTPIDRARADASNSPARVAAAAVLGSFGIAEPTQELMLTCLAPLHGVLALERSGAIGRASQRERIYKRVTDLVITMLEQEGKA